eukprot:5989179-Pyramimonas_sp.AAC.1
MELYKLQRKKHKKKTRQASQVVRRLKPNKDSKGSKSGGYRPAPPRAIGDKSVDTSSSTDAIDDITYFNDIS